MIVDGFKILGFNSVGANARFVFQAHRQVAHNVFDKLWIVVGAFGNKLFIGAFQNAIYLARRFLFGNINQLFQPHMFTDTRS